ncbi:MAG: alcohol dehydrogenase catalytic domain-containing protein [Negativicutes bacterium]|nr:alcohol dehydrogenase catalytic domain-containing protein [Negativicutes bacterium]
MQELYLEKPGELTLRVSSPLPAPQSNEVKIKILYAGLCGSDLRVYKGSIAYAKYPSRPGHEALGVVVAAGSASSLKAGDKVVIFPNTFCGQCKLCRQGQTNICREKKSFGINAPGVFGSEVIADAKFVVKIPQYLPDEKAVLVEPFAVTVHALKKAAITPETTVAVVGCGTEGLLAIALANYLGGKITAVDINPAKLQMARSFGDIRTLLPQDVEGEAFDVVIEAAGVKLSIEQAMRLVRPGGRLIVIGITGEQVDFPVIHVVRNEITIFGTIIYTIEDFKDAITYLSDPAFPADGVLSKIVPYTEFSQAYADALSGNYAKIVLDFRGA